MGSPDSTHRINELEARVAELTQLVGTLTTASAPAPAPTRASAAEPRASRRNMLKLAGAAAVGAVGMTVAARPDLAAAADGDPILVGATTDTTAPSTNSTVLRYTNTANPLAPAILGSSTANMFTVRDQPTLVVFGTNPSASAFPAAIGGYSYRTVPNGVYGLTNLAGHGVVGAGFGLGVSGVFGRNTNGTAGAGAGLRGSSTTGPALVTEPTASGVPTTGTWAQGSFVPDTTGKLWYCTVGGTPGTWVDLAAPFPVIPPDTPFPMVPVFKALTPYRAYDSREALPTPGGLAKDASRTIVIKDQRAINGGAVTVADRVPAGATAITANITVVNTVGAGFLTANPGGDTTINAATINWSGPDQILNNGVTLAIGAGRDLTVIAGGGSNAQTDFVIDVTGYFAPTTLT